MLRRQEFALWLSVVLLIAACRDRAAVPEPDARRPTPAPVQSAPAEPAPAAVVVPEPGELRLAGVERVVAVGDVHGDLNATRAAFKLAGALGPGDRWVGGKLTLVQTGDQLDRGDEERQILDLLRDLAKQASAAGGRVVALNGNHETMNVQGDFRYVTEAGLRFGSVSPAARLSEQVPPRFQERARAFLPGGEYANLLAQRRIVVLVGDSAFVHGGILPAHVEYGLARLNREVAAWMRGETPPPQVIASEDSPVWTRAYGGAETPEACGLAAQVLERLGVARLVVGHTVQKGGISSICSERVWRIDVGLAAYYGDGPVSVLEIAGGRGRVLTGPG